MKLIDLHVHSTASDGTLSPREVAFYAKEKGLSAIALTDHDTLKGLHDCMEAGKEAQVTVIPGIEFSANFHGKEVHILGYYIDPDHPKLNEKLKVLIDARNQRNLEVLERLNTLGMPLSLADCLKDTQADTVITRAHIAKALVEKGYVKDRKEAFSHYLGDGKPAFVPKKRFTVAECTQLIHAAHGLAVLAHPLLYGYGYHDLTNILTGMVQEGIDGIECLYSTHSKADVTYLLQTCLKFKLFPTGGSDFHGANKPGLDLGCGYGDLSIPFDILEPMQRLLGLI